MNWLNKLERKWGRYAISNLMMWIIGAYVLGYFLCSIPNTGIYHLITLSPYYILRGQIWRLVTWILVPTSGNVLSLLIMSYLYYQLGSALERTWGVFRFNAYIFGGMLSTIVGAFLLYGWKVVLGADVTELMSLGYGFSTNYINMSIFLAFAVIYPDMQILLMYIIPVKMKWMAIIYGIAILEAFVLGENGARIAIVMSLLNFIIFFLSTRNVRRYAPKEVKRRQEFKRQMREPVNYANGARHKCAVCGRTELDNPSLEFRFCSKCEGNYEYCQEHLFTHQHIRRS